jgi:hypothetical protein
VELVERDGLLGHLQRAAGVAVFEAGVSGALKQSEVGGGEAAYVAVGPGVVAAFERFAAPEFERRFQRARFAVVGAGVGEEPVESTVRVVKVDGQRQTSLNSSSLV